MKWQWKVIFTDKNKCWNWLNSNFVKDSAGSLCFLCYVNLFILLRSIPQHDKGISSKPHVMSECLNSALNSASSFCFCASYAGIHRTGLRRFSFTWVACGNLKSLSGSITSYTTVVMVQISLKSKKKKKNQTKQCKCERTLQGWEKSTLYFHKAFLYNVKKWYLYLSNTSPRLVSTFAARSWLCCTSPNMWKASQSASAADVPY